MHRMGKRLGWLGTLLLAFLGCKPTESHIQPPPLREEYTLPPTEDARFNAPPVFPREARRDGLNRTSDGPTNMPAPMRGPGGARFGGPGAGGY